MNATHEHINHGVLTPSAKISFRLIFAMEYETQMGASSEVYVGVRAGVGRHTSSEKKEKNAMPRLTWSTQMMDANAATPRIADLFVHEYWS